MKRVCIILQPSEEEVYDLMCAADLYLLPGLKRQCANVVARYLQVSNVVMVIKTARLFNLPRLEDQCAEFMAENIEKVSTMVYLHYQKPLNVAIVTLKL